MAGLGVIGALVSAAGSIIGGISAKNQAEAQAAAMEVRAGEERAGSQREAIRRSREAKLVMSRQQAVAASSGGDASDPTVVNLMAGVAREGEYQSGAALYEGETKGRNMEYEAKLARMQGRQAMFAGFINGFSSMISGFSSFGGYGGSGPPAMPATASAGSGSYFYG